MKGTALVIDEYHVIVLRKYSRLVSRVGMWLRMVSNFWELSGESHTAIDLVKLSVAVLNLLKQGHLFIF